MRPTAKDRQPRVIAGQVNNSGIATAGTDFTVISGGAGIAQITLPANFKLIGLSATVVNPSAALITADQITTTNPVTFVVRTYSIAGAASGAPFSFVAAGVQQ